LKYAKIHFEDLDEKKIKILIKFQFIKETEKKKIMRGLSLDAKGI